MPLQGALGALLLAGPAHGYELLARLQVELGELWEVRPSNAYLTLGRMEQAGLVTSERVDRGARPRQRLTITDRGREVANRWLVEGDDRSEMGVRLAIARLLGGTEMKVVASTLQSSLAAALHDLEATRRSAASGFQRELAELEVARVRAELRWVSQIATRAREISVAPRAKPRPNMEAAVG